MSAVEIAHRLYAALEAGAHGEALRPLFCDDAVTVEHPNRITPEGATSTLAEMLAGSTAGANLLARQHYDVHDARQIGDLAIVRLTWTGVIAADLGPFRSGQELRAHIAQFVEVRDGHIARLETFDCYEPF